MNARPPFCFSLLVCALVALFVAPGAIAASASTVAANVSSEASLEEIELEAYSEQFDVSRQEAREHLETQEDGLGIVERLEATQGDRYSGVWFDNEAGEFVVPVVPEMSRNQVAASMVAGELAGDFRTTQAQFTWEELEAAQDHVDSQLADLQRAGLVTTGLDPRTNAVVVKVASAASQEQLAEVQKVAAAQQGAVEVRQVELKSFLAETAACNTYEHAGEEEGKPTTFYDRVCDKPMRAGVGIEVSGGGSGCSTAFKAIGNVYGNRFVLTAGHCVNGGGSHWAGLDSEDNPHYLGKAEEHNWGGGGDWAKLRVNGETAEGDNDWWEQGTEWPSRVVNWNENFNIPIEYESIAYLGESVCKSGTRTGTQCGTVEGVGQTHTSKEGVEVNNMIEVAGGTIVCNHGDSGGPLWTGNTALGILSLGNLPTSPCWFTEIHDADVAMGVTVGTAVPNAPVAITDGPSAWGYRDFIASGRVNPVGASTSARFEWGLSKLYGGTGEYEGSTSWQGIGSGWYAVPVQAKVTGLKPETLYFYRVVGTNSQGTTYGAKTWVATNSTGEPVATTGSATEIGPPGHATIHGTIDSGNLPTQYYVLWGKSGKFETYTPEELGSIPASTTPAEVSVELTGLKPGTTYQYLLYAINEKGWVNGETKTFSTPEGLPAVVTESAEFEYPEGYFYGSVNPHGYETKVNFRYATQAEYERGEYRTWLNPYSIGSGTSSVPVVENAWYGLSPEMKYRVRMVGTNAWGTTLGNEIVATADPGWPTFDATFGSAGSGNGQFSSPMGIAAEGGYVWVADTVNRRVQEFDEEGNFIRAFGSKGTGNGQFEYPFDIAPDGSGGVWVSDPGNNRVQRFNSKGEYVSKITSLEGPWGVALTPGAHVWVSEPIKNRLSEYTSAGSFVREVKASGSGNGQFAGPAGLAVDPEGHVWVADSENNRIQELSSTGSFIAKYGSKGSGLGELKTPIALAATPLGNIFVVDYGNNRVQEITAAGKWLYAFGATGSSSELLSSPEGIAVGAHAKRFVTDTGHNRISVWGQKRLPEAFAEAATGVTSKEATLKATIYCNYTGASYWFEYGTTTAYGNQTAETSFECGGNPLSVSKAITGLASGTTYHYRLRIDKGIVGPTRSEDRTFTTP